MKKLLFILVALISFQYIIAQNKTITKKKDVNSFLNEKVIFDPKEGKLIPESELDYGMMYFALGCNMVNHFYEELSQDKVQKAIEYFTKAIDNGYINALIYAARGNCEASTKEYFKAILDFSKALELNSDIEDDFFPNKELYEISDSGYIYKSANGIALWIRPSNCYLGRGFCKMELQDYRGAISDFTKATLYPLTTKSSNLYLWRGICKLNIENYLEAKSDFNKVLTIDNKESSAYYNRGFCNYNLKLKDNACKDWSRAGELGYESAYKVIQEYCK